MAQGSQENGALSVRMRAEESHDFVIVESQPCRAQPERISGQVHLSTENSGLQLHGTIAAIAQPFQTTFQVGQKEDSGSRIAGQPLVERQMRGALAEVAGLEKFELIFGRIIEVG